MKRKVAVIVLILSVMHFALGVAAHAQQSAKVAKIGSFRVRSASRQAPGSEVFRRELLKLGYVEGKNITFEYRDTEGKLDRLSCRG